MASLWDQNQSQMLRLFVGRKTSLFALILNVNNGFEWDTL